jgi:hypothetical protein
MQAKRNKRTGIPRHTHTHWAQHPHTTDRTSVIRNDQKHARNYTGSYHDVIRDEPRLAENYISKNRYVIRNGRNNDKNYTKQKQQRYMHYIPIPTTYTYDPYPLPITTCSRGGSAPYTTVIF